MPYILQLILRMNYENAASGNLFLKNVGENNEQYLLKIDLKCSVNKELDALVLFVNSDVLLPTVVNDIDSRGNYEYNITRIIKTPEVLKETVTLITKLSQN